MATQSVIFVCEHCTESFFTKNDLLIHKQYCPPITKTVIKETQKLSEDDRVQSYNQSSNVRIESNENNANDSSFNFNNNNNKQTDLSDDILDDIELTITSPLTAMYDINADLTEDDSDYDDYDDNDSDDDDDDITMKADDLNDVINDTNWDVICNQVDKHVNINNQQTRTEWKELLNGNNIKASPIKSKSGDKQKKINSSLCLTCRTYNVSKGNNKCVMCRGDKMGFPFCTNCDKRLSKTEYQNWLKLNNIDLHTVNDNVKTSDIPMFMSCVTCYALIKEFL